MTTQAKAPIALLDEIDAALEPFAEFSKLSIVERMSESNMTPYCSIPKYGDCRRAAAAREAVKALRRVHFELYEELKIIGLEIALAFVQSAKNMLRKPAAAESTK